MEAASATPSERRRWVGELIATSTSASGAIVPAALRDVANPPGYLADWDSTSSSSSGGGKGALKQQDGKWKQARAWEAAQAPIKNFAMMAFMMWMAGNSVHIFSMGIVFSVLWQPIAALQSVDSMFKAYEDPRTSLLGPKALFVAINVAALGMGLFKLNRLGLLPTSISDWISQLPPRPAAEVSLGSVML